LFAQRPLAYLLDEPLQHLDLPHQVAVLERLAHEARAHGAAQEVLDAGHLGELYGFPLDVVEAGRDRLFLPRRS
jgi:ABC-type hemin transport system ATPase subunit